MDDSRDNSNAANPLTTSPLPAWTSRRLIPPWFVAALLFAVSVITNQACGGFGADSIGSNDQSSVITAPYSVILTAGNASVGSTLTFGSAGVIPAGATFAWSHIYTNLSGAALAPCTELNGESSSTYQLSCPQAGVITLALDVATSDGTAYGDAQFSFTVGNGGGTTGGGNVGTTTDNSAGAALYSTNCSSCHGDLASNNLGTIQVSAIQSAIQTQPEMNSLTSLTTDELQQIADALAGN